VRKFYLLLALLLSFTAFSQGELTKVRTPIFEVYYSQDYEQPVILTYVVDCWDGQHSRSGLDFYKVQGIKTSSNEDYYKNVWDKGHLAPAAAFSCDYEELKATFSYLNCALQHEDLNRGSWKYLEAKERQLASQYGSVTVQIRVHFDNSQRVSGGAMIPSGFTKTIKLVDNNQLVELVYYFPNNGFVDRRADFEDYRIK
jgi:DNA/RNA endonuclease G (NUC1)